MDFGEICFCLFIHMRQRQVPYFAMKILKIFVLLLKTNIAWNSFCRSRILIR